VKSEAEIRWLKETLEKILEAWDGLDKLPEEERRRECNRVFAFDDLIVAAVIESWSIDVYIVDGKQTLYLSLYSGPDSCWDDVGTAVNLLEFLLEEGKENPHHLRAAKKIAEKAAKGAEEK